jgi:hypothetical protein
LKFDNKEPLTSRGDIAAGYRFRQYAASNYESDAAWLAKAGFLADFRLPQRLCARLYCIISVAKLRI